MVTGSSHGATALALKNTVLHYEIKIKNSGQNCSHTKLKSLRPRKERAEKLL
jgi:hypothetical protein